MEERNNGQLMGNDEYILCSAEFIQFMHAIGNSHPSDADLSATIARCFPPLAEKLKIGFAMLHLIAPQSVLAPDGQNIESIFFGSDRTADLRKMITCTFHSTEGGILTIKMAPQRGVSWSRHQENMIRFLAESLFILCGRTRMSILLNRATTTEFMTNTLNMSGLKQFAIRICSQGILGRYVGIFLNLKNFKYINQTVGQQYGDEILIKYAKTLIDYLNDDEAIARPGGDNFALLVHKEKADTLLRMLRAMPITITINGHERVFPISAHVGAYSAKPGDNVDQVLNYATVALNVVKHSGFTGDQLWYAPYMQDKLMHDKQISQLFPAALESGEFHVFYQPKVSLDDHRLCGCEGLCRWFHDGNIVPPMDFIPVLEKEGTICELDFFIFERVCADLNTWLRKDIDPVRVSVNFSQQHLHDPDFADRICEIIKRYDIDSKYIEVELTEMSGAKNHDAMIEFLQRMRDCGICTSIDDFGTGYSSLNMLREFQMDIIKLDKSFLDRICISNIDYKADEIIVENIIRMAQSLNLEIISEGVETPLQAHFLQSVHCNMAQGFLFDKPLPLEEYEKRLLGNRQYSIPEILPL